MGPRLILLDLDGTVYRGAEPTPFAAETLAELRKRGVMLRFLTNNSGITREEVADRLSGMGIEASPEEVVTSAIGAAALCAERGWSRVFAIGEPGMVTTFEQAGITVTNRGRDGRVHAQPYDHAQAVVCGICRTFSYDLMASAMRLIRKGAAFVATNEDATYPIEKNRLEPGAGSVVAAIQTCAGQEPIVVGKPEPMLAQMVLEACGVAPEDALMVGDRLDTDIECGVRAGIATHLVLCGVERVAPPAQRSSEDLRGLL